MTKSPNRPNPPKKPNPKPALPTTEIIAKSKSNMNAEQKMLQSIRNLKDGLLRNYEIKALVNESQDLGEYLKEQELKTNQIRKFLDAVNRLKVELARDKNESFSVIETDIFLLKPKLAYATARQDSNRGNPVKPLSNVITEAIDKVEDTPDFYRLVQLIESIIAYHKAAGGRN
ncbi:MAG: type III-A CRISPR-associated protein Csm2 [Cyanobacteria bacterium J06636_27]